MVFEILGLEINKHFPYGHFVGAYMGCVNILQLLQLG